MGPRVKVVKGFSLCGRNNMTDCSSARGFRRKTKRFVINNHKIVSPSTLALSLSHDSSFAINYLSSPSCAPALCAKLYHTFCFAPIVNQLGIPLLSDVSRKSRDFNSPFGGTESSRPPYMRIFFAPMCFFSCGRFL